jgi:hypothetical protein
MEPGYTDRLTGWTAEKSGFVSRREQEILCLPSIQTGSYAHPASYPMGIGGSFPACKFCHSPLYSAEVKNTWISTPTPTMRLHDLLN